MSFDNKEVMANNLKHYMKKNSISRKQLCNDLNLKYMTVSDWINAKTYPRIDKIELLSHYFNISKSKLIEKHHPYKQNKYASISENNSKYIVTDRQSEIASMIEVNNRLGEHDVIPVSVVPTGADELVQITTASMEPLIKKSASVYIKNQSTVENDEIAIVAIIDECLTCKRVYFDESGKIILKSENPNYKDMIFDADQVRIIGKVLMN